MYVVGGYVVGENVDNILVEVGDLGFDLGFGVVVDVYYGDDGVDVDDYV